MELSRCVVLNPVRGRIVSRPEDWRWSSYPAMVGLSPAPKWLASDSLLRYFGRKRQAARKHYRDFVVDGIGVPIWDNLRQQIYLGGEGLVEKVQKEANIEGDELTVPRIQRRPPAPMLSENAAASPNRNAATVSAYMTGAYSYRSIAEHFNVHLSTFGRIVQGAMQQ